MASGAGCGPPQNRSLTRGERQHAKHLDHDGRHRAVGGARNRACLDTGLAIDGGYVEVGTGDNGGAYAVVDGSDANPSTTAGYVALSSYESGSKDTNCDGVDTGSGTNSGGCLWLRSFGIGIPVPLIACGFVSGPDYVASPRDGCTPEPDIGE